MKHIKKYDKFNEALAISDYKKWSKATNIPFFNKMGRYFENFQVFLMFIETFYVSFIFHLRKLFFSILKRKPKYI